MNKAAIGLFVAMFTPFVTIPIGATLWYVSEEWSRTIGLELSVTMILYGVVTFIDGVIEGDRPK